MVYTVELGVHVSLSYFALMYSNMVEYNPKRFAAAVIRLDKPIVTMLLFSTGKVVCTACKSSQDMYVATGYLKKMLVDIGVYPQYVRSKLRNVVGNAALGMNADLDYLASKLREEACYETELFPGLVYRPFSAEASLLVFQSGAIVITGCKDEESFANSMFHVERIKRIANEASAARKRGEHIHSYSKRML